MAAPVALGMAAAGSIVSAYGNYEAGQAGAAQANYRSGVALMNQQIAQQNANYALYAGEVQAQQQGMKVRSQIAETRAEQGAGGLDVVATQPNGRTVMRSKACNTALKARWISTLQSSRRLLAR
jgi:hypothetical protein